MKKAAEEILIICPFSSPNIGGVESHLDKLIDVAQRDFYITLITYQPLTTRAAWQKYRRGKNHQVYSVKWFGFGWFPIVEHFFPASFLYLFPGLFFKSLW